MNNNDLKIIQIPLAKILESLLPIHQRKLVQMKAYLLRMDRSNFFKVGSNILAVKKRRENAAGRCTTHIIYEARGTSIATTTITTMRPLFFLKRKDI